MVGNGLIQCRRSLAGLGHDVGVLAVEHAQADHGTHARSLVGTKHCLHIARPEALFREMVHHAGGATADHLYAAKQRRKPDLFKRATGRVGLVSPHEALVVQPIGGAVRWLHW